MPPRQDRLTDSAASARELITRPETYVPENPSETLHPANALLVSMRRNRDLLSMTRQAGDKLHHTDAVSFSYLRAGENARAEAAAYFIDSEDHAAMYVSIDPDATNPNMATYKVVDGIITCVGEVDDADIDEQTGALVKVAIEKIQKMLDTTREEQEKARRERREKVVHRTKVFGGTALALTIIAGSVYEGLKYWVIDPNKRAAAAEAAYDKSDMLLPGEGVKVNQEAIIGIPKSTLEGIPEYDDGDTLVDARRMDKTEANGCFEVKTDLPDNSTVTIVTANHSAFEGSAYSIAKTGNTFEICLADVVGGDDGSTNTSDIALQVRKY